ncbi:amino-acid racemase [Paraphotobacterium marinum]|uniref:Amino-acid racemase n=1 Tax=Paraphotobacterium marinum TaxID=1755811 RepID=A0A220VFF1_9GAMM|nr:amino acid racemase [Paraphotobacterium marinum]ASK79138.1 amino-acid racemase [Paraphotobacterium marinum]
MKDKVIGILAGMGPMSTAPFVDILMKEWQLKFNAQNDMDYPHVLIYSLPTPFYINKPIDHKLMQAAIEKGLTQLESYGVDFIAMPCNTAHQYYDALQESLDIKLLHIVEATCQRIPDSIQSIALLATESTMESGIYQNFLKERDRTILCDSKLQTISNQLINSVKRNECPQVVEEHIKNLKAWIQKHNVEAVIIGCTDISQVVTEALSDNILVIDSSKCLAQSIIDEYRK